jgi:hypothetical protein
MAIGSMFCGYLVYFMIKWYILWLHIWYILWLYGIFYGYMVYFKVIWYILWLYGIFYAYMVYFMVIWHILWLHIFYGYTYGIFYGYTYGIFYGYIVENIVLFYHVHCSVHFPAIFVLLFFPPFCTTLNFLFHIKLFDILVCTRIGSAI